MSSRSKPYPELRAGSVTRRAPAQRSAAEPPRVCSWQVGPYRECFVTSPVLPEDRGYEALARAAAALQDRGMQIVSQEVLGMPHNAYIIEELFGPVSWPVTWCEGNTRGAGGTHLWAVAGTEVMPLRHAERILGTRFQTPYGVCCRLGGITGSEAGDCPAAQTAAVLGQADALLRQADMDFTHTARTWFFNRDIVDWYGAFNTQRNDFFRDKGIFEGLVPASTGIEGSPPGGAALVAGLLGLKPLDNAWKLAAVPSPLQCPALEYGSTFSRAVELQWRQHRRLWVSGTASIAPAGESLHLEDFGKQVRCTFEVVAALLDARGMDWEDVTRATAYVKRAEDLPGFQRLCDGALPAHFPLITVLTGICREELLFELELDAMNTTQEA